MNLETLLVPVDFSAGSRNALRYGLGLARHLGAEVTVLHVIDLPTFAEADLEALDVDLRIFMKSVEDRALQRVTDELAEFTRPEDPVTLRVRAGSASQEIVAEVEARDHDLVVMGTHGRTGVAHTLLGSVTERVVRTCPRPVLTIRESFDRHEGIFARGKEAIFSGILYPTDISETSLAALPLAMDLCRRFRAPLYPLRVLEDLMSYPTVVEDHLPSPAEFREHSERRALEALRVGFAPVEAAGIEVHPRVLWGNPYLHIVEAAEECELVVMATHGRRGLAHAWIGSVAERVLRKSPCPVVCVKAETPA